MSTLLITHPACLQHLTPAGHPERPDRLRAIDRALEHERFQTLARVEAPSASLDTIALCHPMSYVTAIREATPKEGLVGLDADTTMSPGSFEAALRAVGGVVHAVDEVMAGKARNAFVATRPPGPRESTASSVPPWSISTYTTATARRTSSGPTVRSCMPRPIRCRSTPAPER
jgi:acetoin utilization deacetylase AcuC-like enzyme